MSECSMRYQWEEVRNKKSLDDKAPFGGVGGPSASPVLRTGILADLDTCLSSPSHNSPASSGSFKDK